MTSRSAPPVDLEVPAPRGSSVRADERQAGDRRVTQRTSAEEREAAIAIALARRAELDCFDAIYRRDFHVILWLTMVAAAVYSYDLLLLTGRLTLS